MADQQSVSQVIAQTEWATPTGQHVSQVIAQLELSIDVTVDGSLSATGHISGWINAPFIVGEREVNAIASMAIATIDGEIDLVSGELNAEGTISGHFESWISGGLTAVGTISATWTPGLLKTDVLRAVGSISGYLHISSSVVTPIGPWTFIKQEPKYGYINNPLWTTSATDQHQPCGYWPEVESSRQVLLHKIQPSYFILDLESKDSLVFMQYYPYPGDHPWQVGETTSRFLFFDRETLELKSSAIYTGIAGTPVFFVSDLFEQNAYFATSSGAIGKLNLSTGAITPLLTGQTIYQDYYACCSRHYLIWSQNTSIRFYDLTTGDVTDRTAFGEVNTGSVPANLTSFSCGSLFYDPYKDCLVCAGSVGTDVTWFWPPTAVWFNQIEVNYPVLPGLEFIVAGGGLDPYLGNHETSNSVLFTSSAWLHATSDFRLLNAMGLPYDPGFGGIYIHRAHLIGGRTAWSGHMLFEYGGWSEGTPFLDAASGGFYSNWYGGCALGKTALWQHEYSINGLTKWMYMGGADHYGVSMESVFDKLGSTDLSLAARRWEGREGWAGNGGIIQAEWVRGMICGGSYTKLISLLDLSDMRTGYYYTVTTRPTITSPWPFTPQQTKNQAAANKGYWRKG